jgi:proteasome-associated ATPase
MDTDPLVKQLETLVKDRLRTATPEERPRLMELLAFVTKLNGLSRLRQALIDTQRELIEARTPPLEYGIFLALCPPRPKQQIVDENGQTVDLPTETELLWDQLAAILNDAILREANPDARQRIQTLRDDLQALLVIERDVVVGYNGQRIEVKFAAPDLPIDKLRPGQQVVLNRSRNVVGLREDFLRGETAEVTNIISPVSAARVLYTPDQGATVLRVQWPEGEKFTVNAAPELVATVKRGDIVQIDDAGKTALSRLRPRLQIRTGTTETIVEITDALFQTGVEIGDMVRVDARLQLAFEKLPTAETGSLTLEEVPDVKYEDIGGLDEQIVQIRDAIELPYVYRNLFDTYQLGRPKGILLYGPPGCGKTMIAKAVANSLTLSIREYLHRLLALIDAYRRLKADLTDPAAIADYMRLQPSANGKVDLDELGKELERNEVDLDDLDGKVAQLQDVLRRQEGIRSYFINVKGPELLNKYVGETESRIRKIFEEAKSRATFYTPVVIFFDEMESMFRTRGSGRSSDVETTIVPQFLSEMDGVEGAENVIIIGASNRSDMIDPAIMRPGRLDVKVKINRPTQDAALSIMALYLTPDLPLDPAGLKQAPAAYGRAVTFKADAAKRNLRLVAADLPADQVAALEAAIPDRCDVRKLLDPREPNGAAFRTLYADPTYTAEIDAAAAREQLAEALIIEALAVLYSSTSRMEMSVKLNNAGGDERYTFPLRDFASGAVLMSVVSRAKKGALKRQILSPGGQVGITLADLNAALAEEFRENAEQFVANWLLENVGPGAARQGDIRSVKVFLEAVQDDPWGMEKAAPYRVAQAPTEQLNGAN